MSRLLKLALVPPVLLALVGCYDFTGDHGRLGFDTPLEVGSAPWTPAAPIATGQSVELVACERLADGSEPTGLVVKVRGRDVATEATGDSRVTLRGEPGAHAKIKFAGSDEDHFRVTFADPARFTLDDPLEVATGPIDEVTVAVAEGRRPGLAIVVRAADGRPLGVDPALLAVDGAHLDQGGWFPDATQLRARFAGRPLGEATLHEVPDARLSDAVVSFRSLPVEDEVAWLAVVRLPGVRVIDAPLVWSGCRPEESRRDLCFTAPGAPPPSATLGGRHFQAR